MFKRLGHINDQIHEVELAKSEIEHKAPIIVGFFLHYAELGIWELFNNFFKRNCDINKYDEMKIDTKSL